MQKGELKRIAIIGGGASGLACAVEAGQRAAEKGVKAEITVYEAKDRVGKKILATGNGRCNMMNINDFYAIPDEKPLDNLVSDGGFVGIFRSIACVGDSLSSGELESMTPDGQRGYHDIYDISWGQYIARMAGTKVYNFSRGGMTAIEYMQSFAEANDYWNPDKIDI